MLRNSEDTFARFVRWSRDGILLTSESGSLAEWNPAMEQITGLPRSDVLGKKLWDIYFSLLPEEKKAPEYREQLKSLVLSTLETGRSAGHGCSIELEIRCPDNQLRFTESCLFPVPAGNTIMAGAVMRDITGRRRSELAVQESNRKLSLAGSVTRHDINNQLTVFCGYLSLLEAGVPATKSADIVRILQGSSSRIQKILKFSKEYPEVGAKPPAWQDLDETIQHAKTTVDAGTIRFSPGHTCKGILVDADPLLVNVFSHLIDNSRCHGERVTEIQIRCSAEEHRLVIIYEDDGIGIPDDIRPVLFERARGKKTGYSLFLIHEILAVTGLTISETGESGKGVRFEILVPEGSFRVADKKLQPY
jgi:PAS domain S-box-containing protein